MLRCFSIISLGFSCFWTCQAILLYPQNTVFQFTTGVSMPVVMRKRGSIVFSYGFQFNYMLPWNLTQFEPTVIEARSIRELNLEDTYTSIEGLLNQHGWGDGRECLLRTICELAETPLGRTDQDVLEEMIHLILTSQNGAEELVDRSQNRYTSIHPSVMRILAATGIPRATISTNVFTSAMDPLVATRIHA